MTSTSENFASTSAAAIKELTGVAKQLINLVGVIKKNVEAYWKIKDAARRRADSEKIVELSQRFSHLGFLQLTMAYEYRASKKDQFDDNVFARLDEVPAEIADRLEGYVTEVEQVLKLLEMSFPELIRSNEATKSLKALLDKKRIAKELRDVVAEYHVKPPQREVGSLMHEISDLSSAFGALAEQSIEIAKTMRSCADAMKR